MRNLHDTGQKAALSDYLAAERTMLAWIRTGLALMGFGFVVARFGLFLQQIEAMQHVAVRQYGLSLWFGILLIVVGVAVNILSGWRYVHLVRELDSASPVRSRFSVHAVVIAVCLAAIGLAMAIYLGSQFHQIDRTPGDPPVRSQ